MDDAQWTRFVFAFWCSLRGFSRETLQVAFSGAPKEWQNRFPSAGDLQSLARKHDRRKRNEKPSAQANPARAEPRGRRIPSSPQGLEAWIAEADCPWEKLSRMWEAQDKLQPVTGKEAQDTRRKERMTEFRAMWAKRGLPAWEV